MICRAGPTQKGHIGEELVGHLLFELALRPTGARDATRTLYAQLKEAILDGRLAPGTRLPPTREARAVFGVSRNTAAEVYDRLFGDGYIVARHGSGTFVASTLPSADVQRATPPLSNTSSAMAGERINPAWLRADVAASMRFWNESAASAASAGPPASIDLRPALVDATQFPFDTFRRLMARELRNIEARPGSLRSPQGNQGNRGLREAITRHIAVTRAVACRPDEVIVTAGAQQAFDLLARVLVTPGKTVVAMEDPGYPPLRAAFAAAGAHVVPVPVDEEGLVVDALPADAGVICVTPSHQFPLGVGMSPARRRALLAHARARHAVIVEDDYDGEFRYDGAPLEALRTQDAADVVCYVGTFSKCMLPAFRLGYVIAPAWAKETLVLAKNCLDWHCPTPMQRAVAAFIAEGHLTQHVRRLRQVYGQRRQFLLEALQSDFAGRLDVVPSCYGMHLCALADGTRIEGVADAMRHAGIHMHGVGRYDASGTGRPGLIFGFGAADVPALRQALAHLSALL
jgi:GntR family transcriptional regulator/MocR family aminotransferase